MFSTTFTIEVPSSEMEKSRRSFPARFEIPTITTVTPVPNFANRVPNPHYAFFGAPLWNMAPTWLVTTQPQLGDAARTRRAL